MWPQQQQQTRRRRVRYRSSINRYGVSNHITLFMVVPCVIIAILLCLQAVEGPWYLLGVVPWTIIVIYEGLRACVEVFNPGEGHWAHRLCAKKKPNSTENIVTESGTPHDLAWRRRGWLVILRARDLASVNPAHGLVSGLLFGRMSKADRKPLDRLDVLRGSTVEEGVSAEAHLEKIVLSVVRITEEGVFQRLVSFL